MKSPRCFLLCLLFWSTSLHSAEISPPAKPGPWADWVERDFPFFSSVLDARRAGISEHNLTPRGLVLSLGHDCWACFDTDLLRIAAIWSGRGVTDKALAPGSYHDPSRKTPGGQFPAPQPDGKQWLANGIYPGWQTGDTVNLTDPREPAPSPEEVGRGPLPETLGRFKAVHLLEGGVILEYDVAGTTVRDWMTTSVQENRLVIERHLQVGPSKIPLLLALGGKSNGPSQEIPTGVTLTGSDAQLIDHDTLWLARIPAHATAITFSITLCDEHPAPSLPPRPLPTAPAKPRWPQEAVSKITFSTESAAYVIDHIQLPTNNPWKRALRLSDIQFLPDGTGVGVTIDGDVWLIRGLHSPDGLVHWKRFASGLHEPMTAAIRDGEIFVFDRNGIWHLRDTNHDGEADIHEMFSNAFAQTADMREFPSTLRLAPGGEFIIAKGGQEATTLGKHNGSILRISADGHHTTLLGYGFRQPNLGVNLRTGLITASDQEGQYIPSTPLHIVRDAQFYGFLSDKLPREQYPAPIAPPLLWLPHSVNASALSQVWLFDAKMGPLNDSLVHIGFNKPELFSILLNARTPTPQATAISITNAFDFPPLNGSVNPADGQLYIAGFQVIGWGNILNTLTGLGRVRYTGQPTTLPAEITPMDQGLLLRFHIPLDPTTATDPTRYSLATWNYKRAHTYGSAQYKSDGTPGIHPLIPSSAYLSTDARSVFLGIPEMQPAMPLRIGWTLTSQTGTPIEANAYTTVYEMVNFHPTQEGFPPITIDLTPRPPSPTAPTPVTVEEGRRLSQVLGCTACHSVKDPDFAHIGPKWHGLFGTERSYLTPDQQKATTTADEAYLRESILDPQAKTLLDFNRAEYAMPSYAGTLTESQLQALILYIKSLR